MALAAEYCVEHYPNRAEKLADGLVHAVGLVAAIVGGAVMLALSAALGKASLLSATGLYALALVGMMACSAAYNLTRISPARPFLRRLDEAAIFMLIAASYTPFTTQRLGGAWSVWATTLVWAFALAGVAGKLLFPKIPERFWTLVYTAFGWLAVIIIRPMVQGVPFQALMLLVAGGLLYTTGVLVFHNHRLPFRRAIWHAFVVGGAAIHYAAIFTGVVLAASPAASSAAKPAITAAAPAQSSSTAPPAAS